MTAIDQIYSINITPENNGKDTILEPARQMTHRPIIQVDSSSRNCNSLGRVIGDSELLKGVLKVIAVTIGLLVLVLVVPLARAVIVWGLIFEIELVNESRQLLDPDFAQRAHIPDRRSPG